MIIIAIMSHLTLDAQDTICAWTFPTGDTTEHLANIGLPQNLNMADIEARDSNGIVRILTYTNGVTAGDYAVTATGWDNGDSLKFWQICFFSSGYENLRLYSKQRSGNTNAGPKYFRVQVRTESTPWSDIPGAPLITVGNDWTTGVVNNLTLPAFCNNSYDTVFVRWLMITNESLSGANVGSAGTSKIDDIYILGDNIQTGIEDLLEEVHFSLRSSVITDELIYSAQSPGDILVLDYYGRVVYKQKTGKGSGTIGSGVWSSGFYLIRYFSETGISSQQAVIKL